MTVTLLLLFELRISITILVAILLRATASCRLCLLLILSIIIKDLIKDWSYTFEKVITLLVWLLIFSLATSLNILTTAKESLLACICRILLKIIILSLGLLWWYEIQKSANDIRKINCNFTFISTSA